MNANFSLDNWQFIRIVRRSYVSRSVLDVSKLWISRRMLVAETTLLRAYGGVGLTVRAQDAIRQGRRVRLR